MSNFVFSINTSNADEIYTHLIECDHSYIPPLSTRVDIKNYSNKIFCNAIRVEAFMESHLAGLVAAYLNDENGKLNLFVTNVSVSPTCQSRGLGKCIMEKFLNHAEQLHCSHVGLEVGRLNHKAIEFYKKFDFKTKDTLGEIIKMELIIK